MTTATGAQLRSSAWFYGALPDLLLGGGIAYLLSVPLLIAIGSWAEVVHWPVGFVVIFSLFISGPHYGATILRVYEQREDRRKYAFFAIYVTLFVVLLFVWALRNATVGSVLFTLYITWAPWHFAAQNYGISLVFLRRRGVAIPDRTKRLLYASFVLSFALAFISVHAAGSGVSYNATGDSSTGNFEFLRLGLPDDAVSLLVPVLALLYAAALAVAFSDLRRNAALRDLVPTACVILMQGIWYSLPAVFLHSTAGGDPTSGLAFAAAWIATAHAAQYLWLTSYYAKRRDPSERLGGYLLKATLAGAIVGTLPGLIFAPGMLGWVPWDEGLAILVFSVVNVHHFILDGVVWKLRDGRVARALLRTEPEQPSLEPTEAPRSWRRPLVWTLGVICLAVPIADYYERSIEVASAGTDMARVQRAAKRLSWIGRDSPGLHNQVAKNFVALGQFEEAEREFRRSLEVFPNADARIGIGNLQRLSGQWQDAATAYDAALALDPDAVAALVGSAAIDLQLAASAAQGGSLVEPIRKLRHARALSPTDVPTAQLLAYVYVQKGRAGEARKLLAAALPYANTREREEISTELARLAGNRLKDSQGRANQE